MERLSRDKLCTGSGLSCNIEPHKRLTKETHEDLLLREGTIHLYVPSTELEISALLSSVTYELAVSAERVGERAIGAIGPT